MDREIRINAEPVDVHRCRFTVSEPLFAGVRRFTSAAEAQGSPLAQLLFAIPVATVSEVTVGGETVTVVKEDNAPWQVVGKSVGQAIRTALAGAEPAVAAAAPRPAGVDGPGDDELYD